MKKDVFQEISEKLSVLITLLARKDEKIAKNTNTALDFFEDFGAVVSNRDVANILSIDPRAVANAKSKRKAKTKR